MCVGLFYFPSGHHSLLPYGVSFGLPEMQFTSKTEETARFCVDLLTEFLHQRIKIFLLCLPASTKNIFPSGTWKSSRKSEGQIQAPVSMCVNSRRLYNFVGIFNHSGATKKVNVTNNVKSAVCLHSK